MLFNVYKVFAYYGALALFAAAGLAFNGLCVVAAPWMARARRERIFQGAIQREFRAFIRLLARLGLVRVEFRHEERLAVGGRVIVANHPSLLDAVFLLSQVPEAFCVFKPSIRRNPVLGAAAVRAGYIANDRGVGLVRAAAAQIADGASLVVFPEGTRTPAEGTIGRFRPGFALIARHADVPVQLVRITYEHGFLSKERACWKLPRLPARVVVEAGPCMHPALSASAVELVAEVEAWFRAALPVGHVRPAAAVATARSIHTLAAS